MNALAEALEDARADLELEAEEFLPDICSLVTAVSVPDGFGGTTETESTIASDIPCKYEALSAGAQRQIGGGAITTLTHKITMPSNSITKVIRPHYKIVIRALSDQPEFTFENPVTMDGSFSLFTRVAAELAE